MCVFSTLTDLASTVPSSTRGCQSGTRSAGGQKISEEHVRNDFRVCLSPPMKFCTSKFHQPRLILLSVSHMSTVVLQTFTGGVA